jgi:hypothetical protein
MPILLLPLNTPVVRPWDEALSRRRRDVWTIAIAIGPGGSTWGYPERELGVLHYGHFLFCCYPSP